MNNIDTGFFTMEDVSYIAKNCATLESAQWYAKQQISKFIVAHPATKLENISKALNMIDKGRSVAKLTIDISNFILAHPSEGLKVL